VAFASGMTRGVGGTRRVTRGRTRRGGARRETVRGMLLRIEAGRGRCRGFSWRPLAEAVSLRDAIPRSESWRVNETRRVCPGLRGTTREMRRGTREEGGARTRLQDEINTILCKRVRLIARGKASGISGIPNKLTLNAEGSPVSTLPPFHLRARARVVESHSRSRTGGKRVGTRRNDEERNIYIYIYRMAPQHAVSQYHLTAISLIRPG